MSDAINPEHTDPEEQPEDIDLSVDAEAFSTPGAGDSESGDGAQMGPTTYGTTCWGTPCPSTNTYSC